MMETKMPRAEKHAIVARDSFPSEATMHSTRTLEPSSMSSYQIVFEDLALVLLVFCDMVWILTDFDVSAAILVDVR